MRLKSLTFSNFKSFYQEQTINVEHRITVLVGKNNVGKSAALQALSLRAPNRPHRSEKTIPSWGDSPTEQSKFCAMVDVDHKALVAALRGLGRFSLPVPAGQLANKAGANGTFERLLSADRLTIEATRYAGTYHFDSPKYLGLYTWEPARNTTHTWYNYRVERGDYGKVSAKFDGAGSRPEDDSNLQRALFGRFIKGVYCFRAERMNIGEAPAGPSRELAADGSNLPQVISQLAQNHALMTRYMKHVQRVLPHVCAVTAPAMSQDRVKALIWHEGISFEREDLAVPLAESGTGISQVLAILYVVLEQRRPQVVLIDEPSSFLHPGAVSELMSIIRENDRHRYVIATHNPGVVVGSGAPSVYLLSKNSSESILEEISAEDMSAQRRILSSVGARLGDVFGPDALIWVEGPTEENCFPLIWAHFVGEFPSGVAFRSVVNTGDFQSKRAQMVADVYRRLSSAVALIPPALGFVFDSERLSEEEKGRLIAKCGEDLYFIPARMYENYLLVSEAVASVISANGCSVSVDEVRDWARREGAAEHFDSEEVCPHADGANILKRLFRQVSEAKGFAVEYRKVQHGVELTEAILDTAPARFSEVRQLLEQVAKTRVITAAPDIGSS